MPRLALFDLDRTVLSVNSATGWVRRELRQGHISRTQALRGAWAIGTYQLGFSDVGAALRDAGRILAGQEESALVARTQAFWREDLLGTIRPGARAAMQAHRAAGDRVALLTSNSVYMCHAVGSELELDGYGCNRFVVQDGRFTGETVEPLCVEEGKVTHAQMLAEEAGLGLEDCVFYTDSHSDLAALEAVGEPVVVHPDPRLARVAARRQWRVERWGG
jgi:HAD superfamily hydrolase (TIGR01490 family)